MPELTTLTTDTLPLALIRLPSGNYGAILYTLSVGDIAIIILLAALLLLFAYRLWKDDLTVIVTDGAES